MAFAAYHTAFIGVWAVLVLLLLQGCVASITHAMQPGAIPGKPLTSLGHASFVFRAHRTLHNSLENLPLFLGTFFLAVFVGVSTTWVIPLVWVFVVSRLLYTLCYYAIATERNPSMRTYFFLAGLLVNVLLLGFTGIAVFHSV